MYLQSSTAPTTMEVRPPKFLHGFGRAQGSPRPSPNAGTAAGGTLSQPLAWNDLDQLAPAATTGQEGVCPFGVAPIRPRWRAVPRSFSTDSGVPKAFPARPRTLEPQRVAHCLNHSPRQHSKCRSGQDTLESLRLIRPLFENAPTGR